MPLGYIAEQNNRTFLMWAIDIAAESDALGISVVDTITIYGAPLLVRDRHTVENCVTLDEIFATMNSAEPGEWLTKIHEVCRSPRHAIPRAQEEKKRPVPLVSTKKRDEKASSIFKKSKINYASAYMLFKPDKVKNQKNVESPWMKIGSKINSGNIMNGGRRPRNIKRRIISDDTESLKNEVPPL